MLMVRVDLIQEASIRHEYAVVGRALHKHAPFLQARGLDLALSTCPDQTERFRSCEHVSSNLGK